MTAKKYVKKWTLQLDEQLLQKAEYSMQLTGFSRQQMLERALKEYIANHGEAWEENLREFMAQNRKRFRF